MAKVRPWVCNISICLHSEVRDLYMLQALPVKGAGVAPGHNCLALVRIYYVYIDTIFCPIYKQEKKNNYCKAKQFQ